MYSNSKIISIIFISTFLFFFCNVKDESTFRFSEPVEVVIETIISAERLLSKTEFENVKHFYWNEDELFINGIIVAKIQDDKIKSLESVNGLTIPESQELIDNLYFLANQNIEKGHIIFGTKKGFFDHSIKKTNHPSDNIYLLVLFDDFSEENYYGFEVIRKEEALHLLKLKEIN